MAKLLHMPEVSANATHAAIKNWTLKEGDTISAGDCIAEIETEKALVELAAEEDAVLGKILVEPGREVEVGAPIGVLFARGETNVDIAALLAKALVRCRRPMNRWWMHLCSSLGPRWHLRLTSVIASASSPALWPAAWRRPRALT